MAAPVSARSQASTPRPHTSVDHSPITSTREFALEKFRRFRQLQEAQALSPLHFKESYNRGKFDVLKVYYPKDVRELLCATARRLSEECDQNLDDEADPFTRSSSIVSKEASSSSLSSKRSMPLLQGSASRSSPDSRISSPTHSLAPSISMSELSAIRGRLLRAADLPLQSPPPSRPLPLPPADSQCSSAEASIKGINKDYSRADSRSNSTAALCNPTPPLTKTPRADRALTAPTSAAPALERTSTLRSSRANEQQTLPDDGWLHPCERDIIIDDVTYLERRDTGKRRGEEEGWKGMASKAASLVKGKAKGRPDTANTVSSVTTQRWEMGPNY